MSANENPVPRANGGSRANSKAQQHQIIASALDWEAVRRPFGLRGGSPKTLRPSPNKLLPNCGRGGHRSGSVETYSPHQRDRQTTNELRLIGAGPNRRADRPMPLGGA